MSLNLPLGIRISLVQGLALEQARSVLSERITQGRSLDIAISVVEPSPEIYDRHSASVKEWHARNISLLTTMLPEGSFVDMYRGPTRPRADLATLAVPTLQGRFDSLARAVHTRIAILSDITDRLAPFQELTGNCPAAPLPDTRPVSAPAGACGQPKIFFASSTEGLPVAHALQRNLSSDFDITVWDQGVFDLSNYTLDALEDEAARTNFAVFVFTPDDATMIRGEALHEVRDNVILELGLFIGRLERRRCFIVAATNVDLRIPTDLRGLSTARYDPIRMDNNPRSAVSDATYDIRQAIIRSKGRH